MTAQHFDTPTKRQRDCLRFALDNGGLERLAGGFWVKPGFTGDLGAATYFSTTTVEACKIRDWLIPAAGQDGKQEPHKVHIITPYGLEALKRGAP